MDDPRVPLTIPIVFGIILIMLEWIDPIFAAMGLMIIVFSLLLMVMNSLPFMKQKRQRIVRGPSFLGLYNQLLRYYSVFYLIV